MNTNYKNQLLIQTFVELDTQILQITKTISADRYIEIGDDPRLVQDIEDILLRVGNHVKSIEPFFNLSTTPMKKANIYFALIKHVNDTLRYLRDVRKRDFGSLQHTRELLEKLKDCSRSVDEVGELITANADIVQ